MANKVYDNEKWWQEHGFEWVMEIDKRRNTQPLYGIQEVILSEYFSKIPSGSKILEFGAGFGRHADYLSNLKNIEYYAVDQSPTMLKAFKAYTENRLPEDKYVLIEPRQRLPFPDDYFDVVFTVSVLIHINPEHIQGILDELKRISKHVVMHFENKFTEISELQFQDHDGCWKHAVQNLYENVEVIDDISEEQTLYISYKSDDSKYKFGVDPVVRERLYVMDDRLGQGLRAAEGEIGWRQKQLEIDEQKIRELEGEVGWRQEILEIREQAIEEKEQVIKEKEQVIKEKEQVIKEKEQVIKEKEQVINTIQSENRILKSQLEAINSELNVIYNSNSWKVIQKLKSNALMCWIAKRIVSTYRLLKGNNKNSDFAVTSVESVSSDYICEDFKRQLKNNEELLAITHKNWIGVKNSTKELFDNCIETEELSSHAQVVEIGDAIIKAGVKKIVFSGFAAGWNSLCTYVKKISPQIEIVIFWHGSTTHMYEDYSWVRYQEILQLYKDKHIDKMAFAKESMCSVYKKQGIRVGFIKNHVERTEPTVIKNDTIQSKDKKVRIGIYSSGGTWNKNAYTQIAAASFFDNAIVNMIPYNERMYTFATQLGLKVEGNQGNISREQLLQEIKKNDINFYVTFSECAPLIPLESLNCGTICLTGNNHHYFEGTKLEELLLVNRPDDSVCIYKQAVNALEHKAEILELYNKWYEKNKSEAHESIKNL